jgi:ribosome-interacting GTPase 1
VIDPKAIAQAKSDVAYAAIEMARLAGELANRQHDVAEADYRYKVAAEKHGDALIALIALLSPAGTP